MKRIGIVFLVLCLLLCACEKRAPLKVSSTAPQSASKSPQSVSAAPAPSAAEPSSDPAPVAPALSGTFVAGWSDEFDQPQLAIGQEADKTRFDAALAELRGQAAIMRYWTNQTVLTENLPLSEDTCEDLIALLTAAPYKTGGAALENPPTGGGWSIACYRASGEKLLLATFNGAWLILSGSDGRSYVFDGTDCGLEEGQLDPNDYA